MHDHTTPAPASRDNLLGFCHAIGNALGFNPIYLRLVLAALLLVRVETALLAAMPHAARSSWPSDCWPGACGRGGGWRAREATGRAGPPAPAHLG